MHNEYKRIGRFTNSNIWKLTKSDRSGKGFGAPALTYIEEKRIERNLGRSIDLGAYSTDLVWGKLMEHWVFENVMGMEYSLCSKETLLHPEFEFWSGSPDYTKKDTVGEMKCFQMKNYFLLSEALLKLNEDIITIQDFKNDWPEVYWQVVGNSILIGVVRCEIRAFCPTEEQLIQIRQEVEDTNLIERIGLDPWQARFITEKKLSDLSHIPEHSKWPGCVFHEFTPPTEDIDFLTQRVQEAEKLLNHGL